MNTRFPSVQVLSSDRQRDCRSPRREVSKSFGSSDMSLLTGPVTTLRDLVDHVPTRESCASTNVVSIKPKPAIALLVFIVECGMSKECQRWENNCNYRIKWLEFEKSNEAVGTKSTWVGGSLALFHRCGPWIKPERRIHGLIHRQCHSHVTCQEQGPGGVSASANWRQKRFQWCVNATLSCLARVNTPSP